MPQDVYVALWMETTPIGADFPHPEVAAVTFFPALTSQTQRGKQEREKRSIIIQDLTSPPGLISFSSFSSLTHSRQLIISLFPQIPQCTCNYHSHACLPPASCPEGGVSLSLSLSVYLSLSSPSCSLLPLFPLLSFSFFSVICHFFFSLSYPLLFLTSLLSHSLPLSSTVSTYLFFLSTHVSLHVFYAHYY